jgi:HEAT repeat protein
MFKHVSSLLLAAFALALPAAADARAFDANETSGVQLIQYLDHPDWHYRHDACDEIADRKMTQAEDTMILLALEDVHEKVRRRCLTALKQTGSVKILPAAETMLLDDADAGNRKYAAGLVEDLGNEKSGPVLAQVILSDADAGVRRKAVVIVRKRGWRSAGDALKTAAIDDPDKGVRAEAREALVRWGDPGLRDVLHRIMLEDPDAGVRRDMVEEIEDHPTAADRDALIKALDDSDAGVARHAARALARLGDRTAAPILREKAMEATDRKVAEEFNEAAAKLGG